MLPKGYLVSTIGDVYDDPAGPKTPFRPRHGGSCAADRTSVACMAPDAVGSFRQFDDSTHIHAHWRTFTHMVEPLSLNEGRSLRRFGKG